MSETVDAPAAIAIIDTQAVSILFAADEAGDKLLSRLAEEVKAFHADPAKGDISTAAGRDARRSLAHKIAKTRSALDKLGLGKTEEWREQTKKVNAERNVLKDGLTALQEEVRQPLTEYEEREERRIAKFEADLAEIVEAGRLATERWQELTPEAMAERLAELQADKTRDWEEFKQRASYALATSIDQVTAAIARRKKADDDAAELAAFRAQAEARAEQERLREQREREERIAAEAAEMARQQESARAEAQRQQELAEAERQRLVIEGAAEEERRAAAAERERLEREAREAREQAEAAAAQAVRDQEAAAERERVAEQRARDAEEAGRRAAENARIREEEARVAAQVRQTQLAAEAERRRVDAEQAAVAAERQRVADAEAAEAEAKREREANAAHKRKINVAAASALVSKVTGLKDAQAKTIVAAIAKGEVPSVHIEY